MYRFVALEEYTFGIRLRLRIEEHFCVGWKQRISQRENDNWVSDSYFGYIINYERSI